MGSTVFAALHGMLFLFACAECRETECRRVSSRDRTNGFLETLENLTDVPRLSSGRFDEIRMDRRWCRTKTYVFYDRSDPKSFVLGTASVIWERKFARNGAVKAHVEDVAVHAKHTGEGIGSAIMRRIVRKCRKNPLCYKILLTCDERCEGFYKRFGFVRREIAMECRIGARGGESRQQEA